MKNWCFTKHQEKDGCLRYICTTRWLINPADWSASGMKMSTQSLLKPGKQLNRLNSCKQETSKNDEKWWKNDGKMDSAFFTPEWYKSIGRTIRLVVSNNIPPPTSWTFGAFWWQVPSQTYPPENKTSKSSHENRPSLPKRKGFITTTNFQYKLPIGFEGGYPVPL